MNSSYQINEVARKRIELVRRKYRQSSLTLNEYLDAIERTIKHRDMSLKLQLLDDRQAQVEVMAKAITR